MKFKFRNLFLYPLGAAAIGTGGLALAYPDEAKTV
eukprot:CAMPEP_0115040808 /NCGR_PEP_ID=MMETSP0216-20121206/45074_1 /TAXON_ID=223996 /ORGANISM="Protocruzia adherens, Strain Boccale" /LENGTH=34 /DNA_ID= /DNA_START= /DNA_END= /DNA_ORIENTATION=